MLVKLPNGDWINPLDVQRITVKANCVVVKTSDRELWMPENGLLVLDQRDQIAMEINAAARSQAHGT